MVSKVGHQNDGGQGCLVLEFGWPGQSLRCPGVAKQQFVFSLRETGASKTLPRPPNTVSEIKRPWSPDDGVVLHFICHVLYWLDRQPVDANE